MPYLKTKILPLLADLTFTSEVLLKQIPTYSELLLTKSFKRKFIIQPVA